MANHGKVANKVLREKRVSFIIPMLLGGVSRMQIIQKFTEMGQSDPDFTIGERMIDSYIADATKRIIEGSQKDRDALLAIHAERLNNLYNRTYGIQDFRTSLAVQQEIAKTFGLHDEKPTGDGANPIEIKVTFV